MRPWVVSRYAPSSGGPICRRRLNSARSLARGRGRLCQRPQSDAGPPQQGRPRIHPEIWPTLRRRGRKWGKWIKTRADNGTSRILPQRPRRRDAIAYLWARTILSKAPACGAVEVPLIRYSNPGVKKPETYFMHYVGIDDEGIVEIDINCCAADLASQLEAVQRFTRGSVTCHMSICWLHHTCQKAVSAQLRRRQTRRQLEMRRLTCVIRRVPPASRQFRTATERDERALIKLSRYGRRSEITARLTINPIRPIQEHSGTKCRNPNRTLTHFADFYTDRQAPIRCLLTDLPTTRHLHILRITDLYGGDPALRLCHQSALHFRTVSRARAGCGPVYTSNGAFWQTSITSCLGFRRSEPLSDGSGDWDGAVEWVSKFIEAGS